MAGTATTYRDLIHPKLEGLIQLPDITSGGGFVNFGGIVETTGGDETNIGPGFDLLREMKAKKLWKSGSEIAATVAFLASDGAGYITGQNLRADGGITRAA